MQRAKRSGLLRFLRPCDAWCCGGGTILKIFVKMMESGISCAVILGILFAAYRCRDIIKRRAVIALSLTLGLVAAILSAVLRGIPNFVNRASFGFWSMLPVVFSLIAMLLLVCLRKPLMRKREGLYEALLGAALMVYCVGSFACYVPALFSQLNSFVYYGESAVSTAVLFRIIGYTLAVFLMLLSAFAVFRCAKEQRTKEMMAAMASALFLRAVVQFAVVFQRLYSLRLIPRRPWIFSLIAWIINHANLFDFLQLLVLVAVPLFLWRKNVSLTGTFRNRAELRKGKYLMRKRRRWAQFFLFLLVMDMLSVTAVKTYAGREIPLSAPENYTMENGMIVIPLSDLEDEHLHRYLYTAADGTNMRFIAIKKAQGSYGIGLDACEICGPSGYFERKNQVVCKLCDVVMNKGTIGFAGGCNPIPFHYLVHDQKIKIDPADLDALSYVFQ